MYDGIADRLQFELQELKIRVSALEALLVPVTAAIPVTPEAAPVVSDVEPWYKQQERTLAEIKTFCDENQAEHQADLAAIETELNLSAGLTCGQRGR